MRAKETLASAKGKPFLLSAAGLLETDGERMGNQGPPHTVPVCARPWGSEWERRDHRALRQNCKGMCSGTRGGEGLIEQDANSTACEGEDWINCSTVFARSYGRQKTLVRREGMRQKQRGGICRASTLPRALSRYTRRGSCR